MGYVFYDLETTGFDPAFDQILQFAAIKTDYELNEIDRFEIRSRLLPHIVPSPGAIKVTGITVDQLNEPALPSHYEMVCAIQKKMSDWTPSIFIGHNSIKFDENFLRQAFYQTLHLPYLTNTNGNCRSDSLRMVQAASVFEPNLLNIPVKNNKQVFKLELLAPANGMTHANAHNAMADVEATLHLCKLMHAHSDELWSSFTRFAKKASANDFILGEEMFSLTEFYFGKPYSWLVTALGAHPDRNSENFVYNLEVNPDEIALLDEVDLTKRLNGSPKPVRKIRTNACPILFPEFLTPDFVMNKLPEPEEIERRIDFIKNNTEFSQRLIDTFLADETEYPQSPHVEKRIYDGFTSYEDQAKLEQFHAMDWSERKEHLATISDDRLRELGERLIYLESREALPEESRLKFDRVFAERITGVGQDGLWLTLPDAIEHTDTLIAESDGDAVELLLSLKTYLINRSSELKKIIADL